MKRNYGVTFAILLSAILVMGSVSAVIPVSDEPVSYPLYAGQDTLVGSIEVTNDGDNLYVTYVVDEPGWCLTETHLHVGDTPVTTGKNGGNPIPGQFDYKESHDCVLEYPYVVELEDGWEASDVRIAAHAAVEQWSEVCELESTGEYESFQLVEVSGDETEYFDGQSWVPAVIAWVHPQWEAQVDVVDAHWVWSAYQVSPDEAQNGAQYEFRQVFDVPLDAVNYAGMIEITADNEYTLFVNGVEVGSDTVWNSVETYDVGAHLVAGENVIMVQAVNIPFNTQNPEVNPGGLIFRTDYSYDMLVYEEVCTPVLLESESAWAATAPGETRFVERGNWATYVEYDVCMLYELSVDSVNNNQGFDHFFAIESCSAGLSGTGMGPSGSETVSDIVFDDSTLSFKAVYDSDQYTWYPSFVLKDDYSLTFVDGYGSDNVYAATGTWVLV